MGLEGKIALVTGASAGIGQATAAALADAGAKVVVSARRLERLEALAGRYKAGQIIPVKSDASKPADIDRLVQQTLEVGGGSIDIVVVNAGHGLAGGVLTSDRSRWEAMYHLNVIGATHLMRLAAEAMIKQHSGDIVVIGSTVGVNVSPFSGYYGASKFAVGAAAEALRREICQHEVRVSVIKPGIVESEFQEVAGYTEENFGKNVKRFGRLIQPEDVARAIVFVVSQPPSVHINDLMIRTVKQDYP